LSCCDGETHVVSPERTWPRAILQVLIGSAHPPNDLLSGASSVYFRAHRTDEALFYELRYIKLSEALVARLLLLKLLDQYLALPTPVATCESLPPPVPMGSLFEPAGFFFEAPVPALPSVHLLVPSLLPSNRGMCWQHRMLVRMPYPLIWVIKTCGEKSVQ
jgi:hypothetical protein